MGNEQQTKANAEQEDDPRIEIAIERTQLAYERTQLAWIRTVLALISAGIAIDKGTEALHQARVAMGEALIKDAHFSGMLLSISGTVMMILATVLHFRRMKELRYTKKTTLSCFYSFVCYQLFWGFSDILFEQGLGF